MNKHHLLKFTFALVFLFGLSACEDGEQFSMDELQTQSETLDEILDSATNISETVPTDTTLEVLTTEVVELEGGPVYYCLDTDHDGYVFPYEFAEESEDQDSAYLCDPTLLSFQDCDDSDSGVHPGILDEYEIGEDLNCDGQFIEVQEQPEVECVSATSADTDHDGTMNDCDGDDDDDGIFDEDDNCPATPNADQADNDQNGFGDACEGANDTDGDGVGDAFDNCPQDFNEGQQDLDDDGIGDHCDEETGFEIETTGP